MTPSIPAARITFCFAFGCALLTTIMASSCAATREAEFPRLRVLAYNVKHGLGMDGVIDLEHIANVIRAQKPDVVTL